MTARDTSKVGLALPFTVRTTTRDTSEVGLSLPFTVRTTTQDTSQSRTIPVIHCLYDSPRHVSKSDYPCHSLFVCTTAQQRMFNMSKQNTHTQKKKGSGQD